MHDPSPQGHPDLPQSSGENSRTSKFLSAAHSTLVGALLCGALLMALYNILSRWLFPQWIFDGFQEIQIYVTVWAFMLCIGSITLQDRHIKAEFIYDRLHSGLKSIVSFTINILGLAFGLVLVYIGYVITWDAWSFNEVSSTILRFPIWIYDASIMIGGLGLTLGYAWQLRKSFERSQK